MAIALQVTRKIASYNMAFRSERANFWQVYLSCNEILSLLVIVYLPHYKLLFPVDKLHDRCQKQSKMG